MALNRMLLRYIPLIALLLLGASQAPEMKAPADNKAEPRKPVLAVMPFYNHTRRDTAGIEAADHFIKCLFKTGLYDVVHPVESIKKLMGYKRGCLGVDDRKDAQRIGKALNCDAVLTGDVRTIARYVDGSRTSDGKQRLLVEVSARLVDVGSGRTLWLSHYTLPSMKTDPAFNRLDVAVAELADSLVYRYPGLSTQRVDAVTGATPPGKKK